MSRRKLLAARRALLVAECALQRATLQAQCREIGIVGSWWGKSGDLIKRLQSMPAWVSILVAAVVAIAPGRVASLARSTLSLLQLWRTLKSGTSKTDS